MRDPTRNVGPRGSALIRQLVRDVVEGQHRPVLVAHPLYRESPLGRLACNEHIRLGLVTAHEFAELGRNIGKAPSLDVALLALEQIFSRAVHKANTVRCIDRDYARAYIFENRLHERTAGVELSIRGAQFGSLSLEPVRHPIEGFRKRLDLIVAGRDWNTRREVTPFDAARGSHKSANRSYHPIGKLEGGKDCEANDDQCAKQ